ncbi:hypothetical protein D3C75_675840 [compost metagenome]
MVGVYANCVFLFLFSRIKNSKSCSAGSTEDYIRTGVILYKRQLFSFGRIPEITSVRCNDLDVRIYILRTFDITYQKGVDSRNIQTAKEADDFLRIGVWKTRSCSQGCSRTCQEGSIVNFVEHGIHISRNIFEIRLKINKFLLRVLRSDCVEDLRCRRVARDNQIPILLSDISVDWLPLCLIGTHLDHFSGCAKLITNHLHASVGGVEEGLVSEVARDQQNHFKLI